MKRKKQTKLITCAGILLAAAYLSGCGAKETFTPQHTDVAALDRPAEIYVKQVEGLDDSFWLGVDVSSILAEEESGVVFYNEDGEQQDIFQTLKESGVNAVRIRVWNDPWDEDGNSYGGGHNDLETAITIGQRATDYGMSVLIDFHYSDFWADPNKQMAPLAWAGMSVDEKCEALAAYTEESLNALLDAGVDVAAVQVGNETTTGMSGEKNWDSVLKLFSSGCDAVRRVSEKREHPIQIVLHFTNPENRSQFLSFAKSLNTAGVDYDIFATSYYPFWHGTLENLTSALSEIAAAYHKKVMVAEVSYCYTMSDGDGSGNSISESAAFCELNYPVSVQGQADAVRDVVNAVASCGDAGVGVFYWEPAWIPVPGATYQDRQALWEANGAGWASSYAGAYDPDDAGRYYGGSSWDNQALFDFDGHPLASLSVFRYLADGAETELQEVALRNTELTVRIGDEILLPQTATVIYNDGSEKEEAVTWDVTPETTAGWGVGDHTAIGTLARNVDRSDFDPTCKCIVHILDMNFVANYSFEEEDTSMWTITDISGTTDEIYVIDKSSDAVTGDKSMHFYSTGSVDFTVEQTITGLAPGTYYFQITLHGGDADPQDMSIYAIADGETYTAATDVGGWTEYRSPRIDAITTTDGTITVGAHIIGAPGAWGNLDDFILAPVSGE